MMIVGAIIVFSYTLLGGFLAESLSDFIQGTVMIVALAVILIGSIVQIGGIDNVVSFIQGVPGFGSLTHEAVPLMADAGAASAAQQQLDAAGMPLWGDPSALGIIAIISTMAWGLGYFGMPQVLLRFMAIRTSHEVKIARRVGTTWCVLALAAAVAVGLIGRALDPDMFLTASSAESVFIGLSQLLLPAFLAGVMLSGILAATISSADSYMLIASSAIAKNLFGGLLKKDASEKQIMWVARVTMVVILIFGILVALDENSLIFDVVSYAWAGFGATFGPLVLLSLFWRRINLPGALAGMIGGGATVFIWHELIAPLGATWPVLGIYELLPAFIVGLVAAVVVSLLTKPPSEAITNEFDHYMELDV
jgi:sodium/proline symporter